MVTNSASLIALERIVLAQHTHTHMLGTTHHQTSLASIAHGTVNGVHLGQGVVAPDVSTPQEVTCVQQHVIVAELQP